LAYTGRRTAGFLWNIIFSNLIFIDNLFTLCDLSFLEACLQYIFPVLILLDNKSFVHTCVLLIWQTCLFFLKCLSNSGKKLVLTLFFSGHL
jgi:hypothetical protein